MRDVGDGLAMTAQAATERGGRGSPSTLPPTLIEVAAARQARRMHRAGSLDAFRDGLLHGSAWDRRDWSLALEVEIHAGDASIGSVRADTYRKDLELAGIGDGCHAFRFRLPEGLDPAAVWAVIKGTGNRLELGPFFLPPESGTSSASPEGGVESESQAGQAPVPGERLAAERLIASVTDRLDRVERVLQRLTAHLSVGTARANLAPAEGDARWTDLQRRLDRLQGDVGALATSLGSASEGLGAIQTRVQDLASYKHLVTLQQSLLPGVAETRKFAEGAEQATARIEGFLNIQLGDRIKTELNLEELGHVLEGIGRRLQRQGLMLGLLGAAVAAELALRLSGLFG